MYLTDIRGFSAESDISVFPTRLRRFLPKSEPLALSLASGDTLFRAQKQSGTQSEPLCRITLHGMGISGNKGITTHFARFCRLYDVSPRFLSVSDMGIAFFIREEERERVLDALEAYFPMWT